MSDPTNASDGGVPAQAARLDLTAELDVAQSTDDSGDEDFAFGFGGAGVPVEESEKREDAVETTRVPRASVLAAIEQEVAASVDFSRFALIPDPEFKPRNDSQEEEHDMMDCEPAAQDQVEVPPSSPVKSVSDCVDSMMSTVTESPVKAVQECVSSLVDELSVDGDGPLSTLPSPALAAPKGPAAKLDMGPQWTSMFEAHGKQWLAFLQNNAGWRAELEATPYSLLVTEEKRAMDKVREFDGDEKAGDGDGDEAQRDKFAEHLKGVVAVTGLTTQSTRETRLLQLFDYFASMTVDIMPTRDWEVDMECAMYGLHVTETEQRKQRIDVDSDDDESVAGGDEKAEYDTVEWSGRQWKDMMPAEAWRACSGLSLSADGGDASSRSVSNASAQSASGEKENHAVKIEKALDLLDDLVLHHPLVELESDDELDLFEVQPAKRQGATEKMSSMGNQEFQHAPPAKRNRVDDALLAESRDSVPLVVTLSDSDEDMDLVEQPKQTVAATAAPRDKAEKADECELTAHLFGEKTKAEPDWKLRAAAREREMREAAEAAKREVERKKAAMELARQMKEREAKEARERAEEEAAAKADATIPHLMALLGKKKEKEAAAAAAASVLSALPPLPRAVPAPALQEDARAGKRHGRDVGYGWPSKRVRRNFDRRTGHRYSNTEMVKWSLPANCSTRFTADVVRASGYDRRLFNSVNRNYRTAPLVHARSGEKCIWQEDVTERVMRRIEYPFSRVAGVSWPVFQPTDAIFNMNDGSVYKLSHKNVNEARLHDDFHWEAADVRNQMVNLTQHSYRIRQELMTDPVDMKLSHAARFSQAYQSSARARPPPRFAGRTGYMKFHRNDDTKEMARQRQTELDLLEKGRLSDYRRLKREQERERERERDRGLRGLEPRKKTIRDCVDDSKMDKFSSRNWDPETECPLEWRIVKDHMIACNDRREYLCEFVNYANTAYTVHREEHHAKLSERGRREYDRHWERTAFRVAQLVAFGQDFPPSKQQHDRKLLDAKTGYLSAEQSRLLVERRDLLESAARTGRPLSNAELCSLCTLRDFEHTHWTLIYDTLAIQFRKFPCLSVVVSSPAAQDKPRLMDAIHSAFVDYVKPTVRRLYFETFEKLAQSHLKRKKKQAKEMRKERKEQREQRLQRRGRGGYGGGGPFDDGRRGFYDDGWRIDGFGGGGYPGGRDYDYGFGYAYRR